MREADLETVGERVIVGRIKGAWGLRGDLKVEVLTDVATRFAPGSVLYLESRCVRVQQVRDGKGGLVVKLDAVNHRSLAESLRGQLLTVPQYEVETLPEDSYYYFQIIDMGVQTEQGDHLGTIKEIISTGANDVYVVSDEGRRDLLIPALADVVVEVDLRENRMIVRLPEGLE